MGKQIIGIVLLIAICVGGYYVWEHYRDAKLAASGEVQCVSGCDTPEDKARFDKENHGETADGNSEHKTRTASQEAAVIAAGGGEPVNGQTPPIPATAPTAGQTAMPQGNYGAGIAPPATMAAAPAPMQPMNPAMVPPSYTTPVGMPIADSQTPNAANGMRFGAGAAGSYQWYRQGNLTWRVNSSTGQSCIDFATLEEWRKQIVLANGCRRSA